MLLMMWVESSRCFPVRIPSAWMIRSVVSWKASRPPSCCIRRTRKLCSVFWGRWVSSISSRRAWCQSRLNSSCSRASSSVRLNISLRRWTPRTVCTARLGRPLSAQYIGAKRSSSIRGSASFRKTSAQLRSKRLAFFGGTRNSDCHRLTCGSRSRNMLTSPAQVQHLAASPHYPCLAPAWRGVFTNESMLRMAMQETESGLACDLTLRGASCGHQLSGACAPRKLRLDDSDPRSGMVYYLVPV